MKIDVGLLQDIDEKVEVTLVTGEKLIGYFDCAFPLESEDEDSYDFEMCIDFNIVEPIKRKHHMLKEKEIARYRIIE